MKEKRSLNANSYMWELINELGNVLSLSKEEIYLNMLKNYGQSEIVSVKSEIDVSGYFKYCEIMGKGYVNNIEFTHYKVFKGSSEMDTYEMSKLIDGIVHECNNLGIPTLKEE